MKNDEAIKLLANPQFLDKLYAYAYRHCSTSHEAQDLCSDMILAILKALRKNTEIRYFPAFAWTVAHRVHADYCEKRKRENDRFLSMEDVSSQEHPTREINKWQTENMTGNPIETMLEEQFEQEEQEEQLRKVFREMSFLSQSYRSVMIMYYLEERKIADIAASLGLNENTVKQRLFLARKTIQKATVKHKKEDHKMEQHNQNINRTLQPISLCFIGTGNPEEGDPRDKAERILSQNLIYLCRSDAKSAEELARELNVPMPYIEQELEIQCRGVSGSYGMLRSTGTGKYISNVLMVDKKEYLAANDLYRKHAPAFCQALTGAMEAEKEGIAALQRPDYPEDSRLLRWLLVSRAIWAFQSKVKDELRNAFSDTEPAKRPYTTVAIEAFEEVNYFYGCDGITAGNIGGYSHIFMSNLYGNRLQKHFACGHNISQDPLLLLTIRCVGGLALDTLNEEEQEIAAKAIRCGYLRKDGNLLKPAIVVLDEDTALWDVADSLTERTGDLARGLAAELAEFMKKHIPQHLMAEYVYYNDCIASNRFFHDVIEECISRNILNAPKDPLGPEGVLMVLTK